MNGGFVMGQVRRISPKRPRGARRPIKLKGVIVILLIAYLVHTLSAQYIGIRKARAEENRIRTQIEQMEEENQRLREELKMMQRDEYIEKAAREELGLIKSGEIMFVDVNYGSDDTDN